MTVGQLIKNGLFIVLNNGNEDRVINNVFSCDLLSLVMIKDLNCCAWFTGASCVIVCEGVQPDEEALRKAGEHNVNIFATELPVFEAALKLNALTGV